MGDQGLGILIEQRPRRAVIGSQTRHFGEFKKHLLSICGLIIMYSVEVLRRDKQPKRSLHFLPI